MSIKSTFLLYLCDTVHKNSKNENVLINNQLRKMQTFPPNFLVSKFFVNGHFMRIFGPIAQKPAETVGLLKIYSPGYYMGKLILNTVKNINNL